MGLFRKTKKNMEKTNEKCELCGKAFKNIINQRYKHVCEECYLKILNGSNDEK